MATTNEQRQRRAKRTRFRMKMQRAPKPRLSVFRSNSHIYAQVINDREGVTLAAASSLADLAKEMGKKAASKDAATQVGKLIAERALKAGVKAVVFDKGPYRYHGQVAALATGAREAGLEF